jgi:diguanylate cyclase (GGDEF)-like protein
MMDVLRKIDREKFERRIDDLVETKRPFSLILASIDEFTTINDFYGHKCGDQVLVMVGQSLAELDNVEVYRFSGSQFVLVAFTQNKESIQSLLKKMRATIRVNRQLSGIKADLTISVGICLSAKGLSIDDYYDHLNLALRNARCGGKEGSRYFDKGFEQDLCREIELIEQIDLAIQQDEFELHMQPLYNLRDKKLVGYEVLLRWPTRERMDLDIGEIIEAAEKSGIIMKLDKWIVTHVFKLIKRYRPIFDNKKVCINISAQSFLTYDFLKFYMREEEAYKIDSKLIELEITEYSMIHDLKRTIRMMMVYKSRGTRFALDDFGTKYSSINYIKELPFDTLKIDKSYIDSICMDSKSRVIVGIILDLCRELGFTSISEGIETKDQAQMLKEMGCDVGQGYYLNKPMPISDIIQSVS